MIAINRNCSDSELRAFALQNEAHFVEDYGAVRLEMDNENGSGYISSYCIHAGLTVKTYNIIFSKDVEFKNIDSTSSPVYFIYCLKGHYFHKFVNENAAVRVAEMQNVILKSNTDQEHVILFPANVKLEISVIFLDVEKLKKSDCKVRYNLDFALEEVSTFLDEGESFKYFGSIDPRTASYSENLIHNKRTDAIGKLMSEGAIMNTLASQLRSHDEATVGAKFSSPLSASELKKVALMSDFISKSLAINISVKILSSEFGISPKKLQLGCQYLYGETINSLISNLRMERANEMIQKTDSSLSEICYAIGLNSRSYFSKIFKQRFGMLPSEYKKAICTEDTVFELTYRSMAKKELTTKELNTIVSKSKEKNKDLNITGCLCYYRNHFLQILEGPKNEILELYNKLMEDARHKNLQIIWSGISFRRSFSDWSMAFISEQEDVSLVTDGELSHFDLDTMVNQSDSEILKSDVYWKRMRNILKLTDVGA